MSPLSLRSSSISVPFTFFIASFSKLFFCKGQVPLSNNGLFVNCIIAGPQNLTHVVFTAPNLRYTAVNIQQGIDRLHTCTHGVLRSENGIARCLGKLTDESEVHGAVRHYLRAVGILSSAGRRR